MRTMIGLVLGGLILGGCHTEEPPPAPRPTSPEAGVPSPPPQISGGFHCQAGNCSASGPHWCGCIGSGNNCRCSSGFTPFLATLTVDIKNASRAAALELFASESGLNVQSSLSGTVTLHREGAAIDVLDEMVGNDQRVFLPTGAIAVFAGDDKSVREQAGRFPAGNKEPVTIDARQVDVRQVAAMLALSTGRAIETPTAVATLVDVDMKEAPVEEALKTLAADFGGRVETSPSGLVEIKR